MTEVDVLPATVGLLATVVRKQAVQSNQIANRLDTLSDEWRELVSLAKSVVEVVDDFDDHFTWPEAFRAATRDMRKYMLAIRTIAEAGD